MINYKHLHYFCVVAKESSIVAASKLLHVTPQTISGQLSLLENQLGVKLFAKAGRNLELTETGRLVLSYADEIFSLGSEIEDVIHQLPKDRPQQFRVGVVDVVPKSIAHQILAPVLNTADEIRMTCREASLDSLLAELSVHRLDVVLSDQPLPATISARGYSHKLGECGISFLATESLSNELNGEFPSCLAGAPLLLPSKGTQLRAGIDQWIDKHHLHPRVVAEFDDSALLKSFGKNGAGVFIAPTAIEVEIQKQYDAIVIGRSEEIKESFYAISVERRITHPVVSVLLENSRQTLFS